MTRCWSREAPCCVTNPTRSMVRLATSPPPAQDRPEDAARDLAAELAAWGAGRRRHVGRGGGSGCRRGERLHGHHLAGPGGPRDPPVTVGHSRQEGGAVLSAAYERRLGNGGHGESPGRKYLTNRP